jgi:hypothetical protein
MRRNGPRIRSSDLPVVLCLLGLAVGSPCSARAECGVPAPDYAADRRITVSGHEIRMQVHSSGNRTREEADLGGGLRVTIQGLSGGRTVTFDPQARQGMELPSPHGVRPPGRVVDEVRPDGTRGRIQQVQSHGRWLEVSRTTCRADGVMLMQNFVSIDPKGQEITGSVTQDHIQLGAQPAALFEVPPGVHVAPAAARRR